MQSFPIMVAAPAQGGAEHDKRAGTSSSEPFAHENKVPPAVTRQKRKLPTGLVDRACNFIAGAIAARTSTRAGTPLRVKSAHRLFGAQALAHELLARVALEALGFGLARAVFHLQLLLGPLLLLRRSRGGRGLAACRSRRRYTRRRGDTAGLRRRVAPLGEGDGR